MREINVLVCDDEQRIVDDMKIMLRQYQRESGRALNVLGVTDYAEAGDFDMDLVFLDVEMPGCSGIEIKDQLAKEKENSLIIFVTSHGGSVYEAFGHNVIGFFEKPMDYRWLCILMKKFFDLYSIYETVELDENQRVYVGDIKYIRVKGAYSEVYMVDQEQPLTVHRSLSAWQSILPLGDFLRISDSCIVGCAHVRKVEKKGLLLDGSDELFAFRTRRKKECVEKYMDYCRKMARYG